MSSPGGHLPDSDLRRLSRSARWTALRIRIDASLRRSVAVLPLPLVYAISALTWIKVAQPSAETERLLVWGSSIPLSLWVGAVLVSWFRRRPQHFGAMALDRHYGLKDRITTALTFGSIAPEKRSPLMEAAMADALQHAGKLKPRKAAPIRFPRETLISVTLAAGLCAIALLEVRTYRPIPPPRNFQPMTMTADDIELFREIADELEQNSQDPEALAAVRRFNQLIEDIAQRRLDRQEVFRRMAELERDLSEGAEADRDALEEGLKSLAKELEKSDLTKPMAEALKEKRLEDAEKALRELAEKLKNKQDAPSKAQLQKLRDALKKASKVNSQRQKSIEERRQQLARENKRLLKKKREQGGKLSPSEQQQLERNKRKLERLNREKDRADRAKRKLSKLDQELAKAAAELMKELGQSAKHLESGAESLSQMAKQELTDKEKRELKKKLEELRELLRQQGKGSKERMERLRKFGQRARGQKPGEGGQGQGQKRNGKGPTMLGLGKGGTPIAAGQRPGPGSQSGPSGGQPAGQGKEGNQPGGGGNQGGQQWGSGHDGNLKGDQTDLKGKTQDVTAVGVDSGEGTASAEVIAGAAQRGFVGRGYQKVYTDYHTVAERVMDQEEIPSGYRFYVQRYFQLIRPRE